MFSQSHEHLMLFQMVSHTFVFLYPRNMLFFTFVDGLTNSVLTWLGCMHDTWKNVKCKSQSSLV